MSACSINGCAAPRGSLFCGVCACPSVSRASLALSHANLYSPPHAIGVATTLKPPSADSRTATRPVPAVPMAA